MNNEELAETIEAASDHIDHAMVETKMICFDTRPVLYAVPCIPNDGMEPMPLQQWVDSLINGCEVA